MTELLTPLTGDWKEIFAWYLLTLVVTLGISSFTSGLDIDFDDLKDYGPGLLYGYGALIAPALEEIAFRMLIPNILFTLLGVEPMKALGYGCILWVLVHKKRAVIIFPTAFLYYKLWAGGLMLEAIVIHTIHNFIFVTVYLYQRDGFSFTEEYRFIPSGT